MRALLCLALLSFAPACESKPDPQPDPQEAVLGEQCDIAAAPAVEGSSVRVASNDPSCGDAAACVFALELGAMPCAGPGDCAGENTTCEAGSCVPVTSVLEERSMCAISCEISDDCDAALDTSLDTACASGFTCTRVATTGPDCCSKQCVCLDDVDFVRSERIQMACVAGTQAGCCDQTPVPAACG